jgi:hypothetical protein
LWDIINTEEGEYHDDRAVLEAILRAVPPEMIPKLTVNKMAKGACDTIRTSRVGTERIRNSKA